VLSPVICSEIVSNESERFTEETLGSGSCAYRNPEFSFLITGAPIKTLIFPPFVTEPEYIPETVVVPAIVSDVPCSRNCRYSIK
jgi:hypothetical protein